MTSPDFGDLEKLLKGVDLSGLGDWPPKPDELQAPTTGGNSGGWVIENQTPGGGEIERFFTTYSGSQVRIDWRIFKGILRLDWEAKLPDYLKPGQDEHSLDTKFFPAVFLTIPDRMLLGDGRQNAEVEDEFVRKSIVQLSFRGDIKNVKGYDLGKRAGLMGFGHDFRVGDVSSVRVIAGPSSANCDYNLGLTYARRSGLGYESDYIRDAVDLSIPVSERGLRACNGGFAEMLLQHHFYVRQLSDTAVPAARLSGILGLKMRGALQRKKEQGW